MGEDTCKWHVWERVNIQNIQGTHTTQYPKHNMIEKWAEGLNRCFPKKIYILPGCTWKVLNIANHQGNANQNHDEISPHTC